MEDRHPLIFDLSLLPDDISPQEAFDFFKENGLWFAQDENTLAKYFGLTPFVRKQLFDEVMEDIRKWRTK